MLLLPMSLQGWRLYQLVPSRGATSPPSSSARGCYHIQSCRPCLCKAECLTNLCLFRTLAGPLPSKRLSRGLRCCISQQLSACHAIGCFCGLLLKSLHALQRAAYQLESRAPTSHSCPSIMIYLETHEQLGYQLYAGSCCVAKSSLAA